MHPSKIIILWIPILSMSSFSLPVFGNQVLPRMDDDVPATASKIQELRSKLLHLEFVLEEKSDALKQKHTQLKEKGQILDEMELEIQSLKNAVSAFKNPQVEHEIERVNDLEEKVRLLWDESRKNNFELRILEEQAQEREKKLKALASHVQKVKDIITEQWIQIQQIEQALLMAKMRAAKEWLRYKPQRWSFSQAVMNRFSALSQVYRPIFSRTYLSGTFYHLRIYFSYIQNHHFALQQSMRRALESHYFTAPLVHDEIVFFLVSAATVFPLFATVRFLVGLIP